MKRVSGSKLFTSRSKAKGKWRLKKLSVPLLVLVACQVAAHAGEDRRKAVLNHIDSTLAMTEKSRAARCPLQTNEQIKEACNRAYDMVADRQKSYKSQLAFIISVDAISGHTQLRKDLSDIRTAKDYNAEVTETTQWILAIEKEFDIDRE
jgi:hypothetical protein